MPVKDRSRVPGWSALGAMARDLRNPLLRNGHLLTLSSTLTSVIGFFFWTVAAWKYDPATVGRNSAAISLMVFVAAIAQLNLSSAVVRFVPVSGRRTTSLIVVMYCVSGCVALVVGVCAVAILKVLTPDLAFFDGMLSQTMFVAATVIYTIFVIQDSVLFALRRPALVPLENFVTAVLRVCLVVALATVIPTHGIFASWVLALGGIVLAVGVFVFARAIPRHRREADGVDELPPSRQIVRFVAWDYLGSISSIGSTSVIPLVVVAILGAEQNGFFAVAWLIASALYLVSFNMGFSLVMESAVDQSRLGRQVRDVLVHTGKLMVLVVMVLIVFAPYLLGIFGHSYQAADNTLRLLALAALPNLVVVTAINSSRAQRRMGLVVWTQIAQCLLVLPLTWLLLPVLGLIGVAIAWLVTQLLIAGALLVRRDLWLTIRPAQSPGTMALVEGEPTPCR
ncbi:MULTISPECIES: lipopolysaccharide biosynthesis protein [unclassified Mycolicibacterium]|uniref:lipopolysaccharide biosynthesis protein n=1 Tax=unclassified Mycolicibacterium TaxID=2636767 RepID=UPI002ED88B74